MMVTVSAFDSSLADRIERHGNPGSGQTSYLSSSICEEFIESSKYHSLFEGSTPDITGSNEIFGWNNYGNYMMMMVTVSAFDSSLADRIERHGNPGSGQTSYLSSSICEEFIESSKYHSLFEGSTPDITEVTYWNGSMLQLSDLSNSYQKQIVSEICQPDVCPGAGEYSNQLLQV
ncbi:hypothetical protein AVEN_206281-1 [Araneus ventricosus]|uniref:Uncharacterized protein n=1 Tax=Araneus ventricosus TaxID=182803 RepID=A0A4Y2U9A7_ARAVE|nr:hypothetical protein AVEN_206281-1 [Araneus ventricosus]